MLAHIDAHLAEPLELQQLAALAHFSPFHFHRVFAAWMGETLGDHLRRRRLETAALALRRQPGASVLAIALDAGFGSGEAFARAFKSRFGVAPSAWRRGHADTRPSQVRNLDQAPRATRGDDAGMRVQLLVLRTVRIASLRHVGPYGAAVGAFWVHEFSPWVARLGLTRAPRFGIGRDDPSITPPAQCRYDAAVELPPGVEVEAPAQVSTLPGGRYAVMPFRGSPLEIGPAWQSFFGQWLPASGLRVDTRPCYERYDPARLTDSSPGEFACDLCIPIVPRESGRP